MQQLDAVPPRAPLDERSTLVSYIARAMDVSTDVADSLLDLMRVWRAIRDQDTVATPHLGSSPSNKPQHVCGTLQETALYMRIYVHPVEAPKPTALSVRLHIEDFFSRNT